MLLLLLRWLPCPRRISASVVALLHPSLSCADCLHLTVPIFLMSFCISSFHPALGLPLGRFWCKLACYMFLVFLTSSFRWLDCIVNNELERMWKSWWNNYSYWMSLVQCAWAAQLHSTKSLHPLRHPVTAAVLRDTIKGTSVPDRHLPVGAEKRPWNIWFSVAGVWAEIWNCDLYPEH